MNPILLVLLLWLTGNTKFDLFCECDRTTETFLPYAKESNGMPLYVEIIAIKQHHKENAIPFKYYELKVLENLSSVTINDTIDLLMGGGVDCLQGLSVHEPGFQAVIIAFDWNESDYGYNSDELDIMCLSICMVSSISVVDNIASGPITETWKQEMPVEELLGYFK